MMFVVGLLTSGFSVRVRKGQIEELRSALLSTVSHDFRTPLAAITGAGTTLREGSGNLSAEQRAEMLDMICLEAERLERLVGNLLDMTRLESGALKVKREWVPLEEIVGSALTRAEGRLVGRSIRTELPASLPLVSVDPVLFEQAFVNLLDNASKHTPNGTPSTSARTPPRTPSWPRWATAGPETPRGRKLPVRQVLPGRRPPGGRRGLGLAICRES